MAFKITKQDHARLVTLAEAYTVAENTVEGALLKLNEVREQIHGVLEDLGNDFEGQYDDMSEKWQEGERGEATMEWIDRIREVASNVEDEREVNETAFSTEDLLGLDTEPGY